MDKPIPTNIRMPEKTQNEMKAYGDLAKSIGYEPLTYQYERLMFVMQMNDIQVFDYNAVAVYLESKLTEDKHWQWTPLRNSDSESNKPRFSWYGAYTAGLKNGITTSSKRKNGMTFPQQIYNEIVPARILLIVQKLAQEFPKLKFFVSEIKEYLDPFICCSFEDSTYQGDTPKRIIFGTWDEPGF